MSTDKKVLLVVFGVVGLLVVVLFSSEVVEKEIAPKLEAVWVAVEVDDSGTARTGPVEIPAGTPFRLHAVVRARTFSGETIYYTEAPRLEVEGESIAAESLRRWNRSVELRILWFTVEGYKPFVEVDSLESFQEFRFQDNFRADWPRTWSIPGDLRPRAERDLRSGPIEGVDRFGTQRYHVRIEIFGPKSEITPELRLQSLRAADLPERIEEFPTVRAALPGTLALPTAVYGLSQIEPSSQIDPAVTESLAEWLEQGLAFSRLLLLRQTLEKAGTSYDQLRWLAVELGVDQSWGESGVRPGDLLRVGNRWVLVLRDQDGGGVLDRGDLCLDFDQGSRIREIGEVFTGEGLVDWARLDSDETARGR